MTPEPVYLDHAATTPLRPEVREAMAPFLEERFGNPSSRHRWGRQAAAALEDARSVVAGALGAREDEIHFVRGGTESDNLAVWGRTGVARRDGEVPRLAHSAVEHHAVLESAEAVEALGGRRRVLPLDPRGGLDEEALDRALEEDAHLISVMWVNNETGLILPVEEVATRTSERGVVLHSDAVQAVGKVPMRLDETPVDLLTLTGHKIYGPKGTGLLFVRKGTRLEPLYQGGGQERGLRPGTEDVAGAMGLATALGLAVAERPAEAPRLSDLRTRLEAGLRERIPDLRVHGEGAKLAPHILNVGIPGLEQDALLAGLDMEGLAVSGGSACASGASRASHVLRALVGDAADAAASLRYSLGRGTTADEIDRAVEITARVVERSRI